MKTPHFLVGHLAAKLADAGPRRCIVFDGEVCREVPNCPEIWVPASGRFIVSTRRRNRGHDGRPTLLALSRDRDGYVVSTTRDGKTILRMHAAVLLAWSGPRFGREGRHLDGNKLNNESTNLLWGTPAENGEDKAKHGSHKGVRNSQARMSPELVGAMRAMAARESVEAVVKAHPQFSKFAVWAAVTGYTWKHIPGAIQTNRRCEKGEWKKGVRLR